MGTDRLSALPDETLHRVLSHLVSVEAARTAALSRRWRDVYQGVPVVDLVDRKTGNMSRSIYDKLICFDQQVTSALLSKASTTPIKTFRLSVLHAPQGLLDQWIMTALSSGVEELDVKLRTFMFSMRTLCTSRGGSADFHYSDLNRFTKTPRQIFRNRSTLRRLRLTNWTLDMPRRPAEIISSLQSLFLARIMDPNGLLQRLLSSCPRLVHLTLEECPSAFGEISVPSSHLQSFAMVCCHHATRVVLRSRRLRSLRYRGGLIPDLFQIANYQGVEELTIEICQELSGRGSSASRKIYPVTTLIRRCTNLTYLHLSLRPSMAYYSSSLSDAVQRLPRLRQLGLQCSLKTDHAVRSVAVLLRDTRNLQLLSVFLSVPRKKPRYNFDLTDESEEEDDHDDGGEWRSRVIDSLWRMKIGCLDHTLLRINMGNYRGRWLERMLAKFLLSMGAALEEFSVTLWPGYDANEDEIAEELRSWRSNRGTKVTCKTGTWDDTMYY